MYLTDLADACRKSGLRVVEQPNWQGRGHGGFVALRTIACHHTAGPRSGDAPSLGVVQNGRPGLAGPLSNLVLARSGTVYVVAAGVCWHTGATWATAQGNYYAIGIEAEATGVDPWPAAQYAAYVRLCRALADHYRLPYSSILGHKEIAKPAGRKIDPNFDMPAFRISVSRLGTPAPGPSPAPVAARRYDQEAHEVFIETAEPGKEVTDDPAKWPRKRFAYGFDPLGGWGGKAILRVNFGPRGGFVHLARWWIRLGDWTPNNRTRMKPWDHPLAKGGSRFAIAEDWQVELQPGASSIEFDLAAPDGVHIFTVYER